jgi:hypothetical protein
MLFHPYISVPRNDYLDEDIPDDEGIPDFIDESKPDFLDEDTPACSICLHTGGILSEYSGCMQQGNLRCILLLYGMNILHTLSSSFCIFVLCFARQWKTQAALFNLSSESEHVP